MFLCGICFFLFTFAEMNFVDVILPLPLEGLFTYSIPHELEERVSFGVRVLVPLGKSKTYTALAVRVHHQQPEFKVKPISQVLDDEAVLYHQQ